MQTLTSNKEQRAENVRHILFLFLAAFSALMAFILLFIPFCSYYQVSLETGEVAFIKSYVTAAGGFSLLEDTYALKSGFAYVGVGVFALWASFFTLTVVFLCKAFLNFFFDRKKLAHNAFITLIFSTVLAALYFLGGLVLKAVSLSIDGTADSAANFPVLIVLALADGAFAFLSGMERAKQNNGETANEAPVSAFNIHKLVLFIGAMLIGALAICAILTTVLNVHIFVAATEAPVTDIRITGWELFGRYSTLLPGEQGLAFTLAALLIVVGTMIFLSTVSFIAKSEFFYKLNLATVAIGTAACLIVGLFGQYYKIVQALNVQTIAAWLEETGLAVDSFLNGGLGFNVSSASLWFFLGELLLLGAIVVLRPYSKGMALENATAASTTVHVSPAAPIYHQASTATTVADPCPAFTELDRKLPSFQAELEEKRRLLFQNPSLPRLVQFIVNYARDSRLHLSYTPEDIAAFIAGLGTTRLSILQGMSGTGKTSLPKIFAEALAANCELIEVESAWRDKSELLGYYNEFSKTYTPKKFTQALYKAKLNPETLTLIVLDEMNLSRIEYYFSDFLSLMENEPHKRELRLTNVPLFKAQDGELTPYAGLTDGHTLKIPQNVWFVGTANRDESTFEISDKVYDRAFTMNFNKRAKKVLFHGEPISAQFVPVGMLLHLFEQARAAFQFDIDSYPVIAEVERLLAPYNISFGNRIAAQIECFVSIYCACFAASDALVHSAVETVLLSKVVSKLELKSVENKEELAAQFDKLNLKACAAFVRKLNED